MKRKILLKSKFIFYLPNILFNIPFQTIQHIYINFFIKILNFIFLQNDWDNRNYKQIVISIEDEIL